MRKLTLSGTSTRPSTDHLHTTAGVWWFSAAGCTRTAGRPGHSAGTRISDSNQASAAGSFSPNVTRTPSTNRPSSTGYSRRTRTASKPKTNVGRWQDMGNPENRERPNASEKKFVKQASDAVKKALGKAAIAGTNK